MAIPPHLPKDQDGLISTREVAPASPVWLFTFADLMTLIMCFFLLLLSFSEIDHHRFRQVGGSLQQAFGVQRIVNVMDAPKGVSLIAKDLGNNPAGPRQILPTQNSGMDKQQQANQFVSGLVQDLHNEMGKGWLDVDNSGEQIQIRLYEKGSFSAGGSSLNPAFQAVLEKIKMALANYPGEIQIAGHTDNTPIHNAQYNSNWDLSSARAVAVAQALLNDSKIDPHRMVVLAYADNQPLVSNATPDGRARNRRVEIILPTESHHLLRSPSSTGVVNK